MYGMLLTQASAGAYISSSASRVVLLLLLLLVDWPITRPPPKLITTSFSERIAMQNYII